MGTTALRQLLKSLCVDSPWNYTLLWKLSHGTPTVLTWEDGHFDSPNPREINESMAEQFVCNDGNYSVSSMFEAGASNTISHGGTPIGLVVAEMSNLQYALGVGVVGKVALTGVHCWVSFNKIFSEELKPDLVPECPEEWLFQFACGIKTILLVPVFPHGVLQLGSLKEVSEDIEMVSCLKARFLSSRRPMDSSLPFFANKDFKSQLSALQIPLHMPTAVAVISPVTSVDSNHSSAVDIKPKKDTPLNSLPAVAVNPLKCEDSNHLVTENAIKIEKDSLSTLSQVVPSSSAQHELRPCRNNEPGPFKYEAGNNTELTPIFLTDSSSPYEAMSGHELDIVENKLAELSSLLEELQAYPNCNDPSIQVFRESCNRTMKSHQAINVLDISFPAVEARSIDYGDALSYLNFPDDCELHKALGPSLLQNQTSKSLSDLSFLDGDACSSSSLICNTDHRSRTDPSYLLEAVVANAYLSPDNSSFNQSDSSKSLTTLSRPLLASSQPQDQYGASGSVGDDPVSWKHAISTSVAGGMDFDNGSTAFKNMAFDLEHHVKDYNGVLPQKGKLPDANRRRAKAGGTQKPRPRDRQLIQDRVKELRELVPNGSKCSIDGLLDRTIKHMLYLRSATSQSEKLKQLALEEINPPDDMASSEVKGSCHNASWAFEYGGEFNKCPILVEDLACPGHMLIEMICSEHTLFLDIAQVIRNQDLTILKGITETRSNCTWARFIVEAPNSFHRLDIFWPLMQLLQRKRNAISSKI